jgi:ADP-heptose:LPS heptosyltransferase
MIVRSKGKLLKWITNVKTYPFDRRQIKKIVILRYDRIGDMIVSLPLCKALRAGMLGAEIMIIASEVNACIAQDSSFIDRTVIKPKGLFKWINCLLSIRSERPDLVIDLNHAVTPHTIFAIRIMRPKHVASPFKDGRWGVLGSDLKLFDLMPKQHPKKYCRPISKTYLDVAKIIGCPTKNCLPYPLPHYQNKSKYTRPYVVLNPSGSRKTMRIGDDCLLRIARFLSRETPDWSIIIPAMHENWSSLRSLYSNSSNVTVLDPSPTVRPLLPLIQFANIVITPDTALVHIACAYKTPLIAIYTSEQELFEQWRPLDNENARVIRSGNEKSLDGFSVTELLRAISEFSGIRLHGSQNSLG